MKNLKEYIKEVKEFSPYKIMWVALIPETGVATKKDQTIAGVRSLFRRQENILKHFVDNEAAKKWIDDIQNKLEKNYIAYIFSDKQFGDSSPKNKDKEHAISMGNGNYVLLTTMQFDNAIEINKK